MKDSILVVFDTETTGTGKDDRIVQIASQIFNKQDGFKEPKESLEELCKAPVPVGFDAMSVNHITNDMLDTLPEVYPNFKMTDFYQCLENPEFNSVNNVLIAHNIGFDLDMLKKDYDGEIKLQIIDSQRVAKHLIKSEKYRLQYLRYSLGIHRNERGSIVAHTALSDVEVLRCLLDYMVETFFQGNIDLAISQMIHLTNSPVIVDKIPFGKYKDKSIESIVQTDKNYAKWLINNCDDSDIVYTVKYYM